MPDANDNGPMRLRRRPPATPDPRTQAQTRARYKVVNLIEQAGGTARMLPWRLMIHPDRITVGTLAALLHDLGHELVLRAVPISQAPAGEKPAPPSVPGVDADRLARYEALRTGPDAQRVADALARDWRAVGGYLDEAMRRVGRRGADRRRGSGGRRGRSMSARIAVEETTMGGVSAARDGRPAFVAVMSSLRPRRRAGPSSPGTRPARP